MRPYILVIALLLQFGAADSIVRLSPGERRLPIAVANYEVESLEKSDCATRCVELACGTFDSNCVCAGGNSTYFAVQQCIDNSCPRLIVQSAHLTLDSYCNRNIRLSSLEYQRLNAHPELGSVREPSVLEHRQTCGAGCPSTYTCCADGTCAPQGTVCCGSGKNCPTTFPKCCLTQNTCLKSSEVCCDTGKKACSSFCIGTNDDCCGTTYCAAGTLCCKTDCGSTTPPCCLKSGTPCCDTGKKACGAGCIDSAGDCCKGGTSYCTAGKKCCNDGCIDSTSTCCATGQKICGSSCIASTADCCDTSGSYCASGKKCCGTGCIDSSGPCCTGGQVACVTGCMPSGAYCCTAENGYCSAGSTCRSSACYTTYTYTTPTSLPGGTTSVTVAKPTTTTTTPSTIASLTTMPLVITSVVVTTPTTTRDRITAIPPALYKGSGALLTGVCATGSSTFTMVDAGATVYYAPFVGCNGDRPECCPWKVGSAPPSSGTTSPVISSAGSETSRGSSPNRVGYPQPEDGNQAVLSRCPDDYYSTLGSCLPSNFQPYGQAIGGATPAFSSRSSLAVAPTITVGIEDGITPTADSRPTVAILNVVWAMQYAVADQGADSSMSMGAKIGIGVGVPMGIIGLGLLSFFFWRARESARQGSSTPGPVSAQFVDPPLTMGPPMSQHTFSHGGHPGSISAMSGHQSVGTNPPSIVSSSQPMIYGGPGSVGLAAAGAGTTQSWHQPSHTNSYRGSSAASPAYEGSTPNQRYEIGGENRYHSQELPGSPHLSQHSNNGAIYHPTPQYGQPITQYTQY